jgi:xanthine dehydrogenase YagT iron-sulfur-binding subunit
MTEKEPSSRAATPEAGHNRRDFLRGSGLAAASTLIAQTATTALQEAQAAPFQEGPKVVSGNVAIELKVNGEARKVEVETCSTLLDTLRNRLDVTGPKRVCDRASCGACTVILDGEAVYSCTTLAISCQGRAIETLESFGTEEGSVPDCFRDNDALMCGYCTPGFVTAVKAAIDKNPNATTEELKKAVDGNICRCGTYVGVLNAAIAAAKAARGA